MGGLLDFSFDIHRHLVNDLDPHPVNLMAGFGLVFPDCGKYYKTLKNLSPFETRIYFSIFYVGNF